MEKVKISRTQADAINWVTDRQGRDLSHTELITEHSKDSMAWGGKAKGLKKMPLLTLVDALRIGYEVEEKYEVGDWVVKKGSNRIAKITKIVDGYMVYGHWNNQDMEKWNSIQDIRHATPEEIKAEQERRVWAGIGREVNHWRIGDIFVTTEKAFKVDGNKTQIGHASMAYESGRVTGFYPAESFISFGGEE